MQISYQDCYQSFSQSYGLWQNWPIPYQYQTWFYNLNQIQQTYYLNPTNYCGLYEWVRKMQPIQTFSNNNNQHPVIKKLSRCQKRKQKKAALQQEYRSEQALIGKWVQKQRKDLVNGLHVIAEQERKIKQKKQKKLSHLIEIHKEVYKHHLKKKSSFPVNFKKRVQPNGKKKRMSIIKKMKKIFQSRKYQKQQQNKTQKIQPKKDQSKMKSIQDASHKQQDQYQDIDQKDNLTADQSIPKVSFQIKEIQYKNIGKLTGKIYCDITLRQWVTNVPNAQLQDKALQLINRLAYKQAIKKVQKPEKARKIIVSGIKQVKRTLTTILQNKKSRCLIVALNTQRNILIKGIDDQLQKCILLGEKNKIPMVHISTRSKLGRAFTGKFGPKISIISIINFEGYQDMMQDMLDNWQKSRNQYQNIIC